MAPKGVSNRTLLAKKKGIKMGQTIIVAYREEGKGIVKRYEGVLSDRRIGGTDRESFLELKKCLQLGPSDEILAREGSKKFIDAFIDDMAVTEPRPDEPEPSPVDMAAFQNPMAMGMGGMGMGAGMMPMMMPGMMPMGMGPMMPMGMPGMMMPMAAMGMMPGMAAMQQMAALQSSSQADAATASIMDLRFGEEPKSSPEELAAVIEGIDLGKLVRVAYTHPQLGKTTYQGVLREKFAGASSLQSYIRLGDCQRIGRTGRVRETEEDKRLMTAFIDEVNCVGSEATPTSRRSCSPNRERKTDDSSNPEAARSGSRGSRSRSGGRQRTRGRAAADWLG